MAIELGHGFENNVYTGKANMRVLCVNPDLKQMVSLNLPGKKDSEPEYIVINNNGEKSFMLKFWLKHDNPEIVTALTFFLQDKNEVSSQKQSPLFINDFGGHAYAESVDEAINKENSYFKPDGARAAKVGEVYLTNFLIKLFCTQKASIDNFSKLANGDLTEIKKYLSMLPVDRQIQVLLCEKNNYQSVYGKRFERWTSKEDTYWKKYFEKEEANGRSIPNYQDSFKLQKWNKIEPDVEVEEKTESAQFDLFA